MIDMGMTRRRFLTGTGVGLFSLAAKTPLTYGDSCTPPQVIHVEQRFTLSALGWVNGTSITDGPQVAGNRLRWLYPTTEEVGGVIRGIPRRIRVQRGELYQAKLFVPDPSVGSIPTMHAPEYAWRPSPVSPVRVSPYTLQIERRAQAIYFEYNGPSTILTAEDSEGKLRTSFKITDGSVVYLERAAIDRVLLALPRSVALSIKNFKYLDLYRSNLDISTPDIAELSVREPLEKRVGLLDAAGRLGAKPTSTVDAAWKLLLDAVATLPTLDPTGIGSRLGQIDSLLGLSWQLCALSAFGFVDGATVHGLKNFDKVLGNALPAPAITPLAYRLFDPDASLYSNFMFVTPGLAEPLTPPSNVSVARPYVVRPLTMNEKSGPSEDSTVRRSAYVAEGSLRWRQRNQWAIAVEVEEKVSASGWLGTTGDETDSFILAPEENDGVDRVGDVRHAREVPFIDVGLRYRLRTLDGFDRVSNFSTTVNAALTLDYVPPPPVLDSCAFVTPQSGNLGRVTVRRVVSGSVMDDVLRYGEARLFVYRKVAEPSSLSVNVIAAEVLNSGDITVTVDRELSTDKFTGGKLLCGQDSFDILGIVGGQLRVQGETRLGGESSCGTQRVLPYQGKAVALEGRNAEHLWTQRVLWHSAEEPPAETSFDEGLAVPSEFADTVVYAARFEFRKNINTIRSQGNFSNTVFTVRLPRPPEPPPRFTVDLLGRDYYGEMLIEIKLAKPAGKQRFAIAWRPGRFTEPARFATDVSDGSSLIDGTLGPQSAFQESILHEALPSAGLEVGDFYYTIGVKAVDGAGQESTFEVQEVLVEEE